MISIYTRKGTVTNAFFYVFNGLFYLNTPPQGADSIPPYQPTSPPQRRPARGSTRRAVARR